MKIIFYKSLWLFCKWLDSKTAGWKWRLHKRMIVAREEKEVRREEKLNKIKQKEKR